MIICKVVCAYEKSKLNCTWFKNTVNYIWCMGGEDDLGSILMEWGKNCISKVIPPRNFCGTQEGSQASDTVWSVTLWLTRREIS